MSLSPQDQYTMATIVERHNSLVVDKAILEILNASFKDEIKKLIQENTQLRAEIDMLYLRMYGTTDISEIREKQEKEPALCVAPLSGILELSEQSAQAPARKRGRPKKIIGDV